MSKFTIKDNNIKIPVDVDFNALKKKFENSEHFKRFEEIKSTKQFSQMYQDCFEKYQKVVMSVKELSAKEKAELCDIDNIWNCFYANALCNLYSIALERYLAEETPLEKSLQEVQTVQFYITLFAQMLISYVEHLQARSRNIQIINHLKKEILSNNFDEEEKKTTFVN